jgi:arylsulfatase A
MIRVPRRKFLQATAAAALAASPVARRLAAATSADSAKQPNIVFILCDDLGWAELSCYGNTFNETPHLDALARDGMRLTCAYAAAPVCSPTRASLLTGQYPARVGITDYLRANDPKFLSPDHATLPKVLGAAGYASALIGKWHLMGDYKLRKGDPALHGFTEVICSERLYIGGGSYFHPYKFLPGVEARQPGEYLTDRLNLEAVEFIARNKDKHFFLYLSHYAPHTALAAKEAMAAKYKAKPGVGKNKNNPALAAMLESIDEGVGMIMAALNELGLADNTIVIFMSDNGGELNVTSNAPLRGGKSQLYEGGIRVPLIVRWPGVVRPGSVCDVPATSADLYPTMIEMAGAKRDPSRIVDGKSLVPLLRQIGGLTRKAIFWHYPLDKAHFLGGRSAGAVRVGDFKLMEFHDDGHFELYNLVKDLGETDNLASRMPQKVAELRQMLDQWRKEVGAELPSPKAGKSP